MLENRFLKKLIIEKELLKEINLLIKKKELLLLSLNQTNDNLNKIFLNFIQRQNHLFIQEKDQYNQTETLFNQILSNQYLLIKKINQISIQLKKKKKKRKKSLVSKNKSEENAVLSNHLKEILNKNQEKSFEIKSNRSNDEILKIYFRSISSDYLFKKSSFINRRKHSSEIYFNNYINRSSSFNHYSSNIQCNFPKLEKIQRIHLRTTNSQTN